MWPFVWNVESVLWLVKDRDSLTWCWQVIHLELHLKVPCSVGVMTVSLVGGTAARTRISLKLGGRRKATIGGSGTARCRRSAVWRIWWLACAILRMGGREGWYVSTRGTWPSLRLGGSFSASTLSRGRDFTLLMAFWTLRELWPLEVRCFFKFLQWRTKSDWLEQIRRSLSAWL